MTVTARGVVRVVASGSERWPLPVMLRRCDISAVQRVEARTAATVPLMASPVSCGFPSPADDYLDQPLDFNELLRADLPSIFCVTIAGDSMILAGLFPGDVGVIDRARPAVDGAIILASLDGEFTIKRYRVKAGRFWLQPENPRYQNIYPAEDSQFQVWGVVWRSIRMFCDA